MEQNTNYVFSYGSLVDKFHKKIIGEATLVGNFSIDRSDIFPELRLGKEKISVHGHLLELTDEELKKADNYEGDIYERILLKIESHNIIAWVYISK